MAMAPLSLKAVCGTALFTLLPRLLSSMGKEDSFFFVFLHPSSIFSALLSFNNRTMTWCKYKILESSYL